ncbi:MAG TPA: hypothetical protein VJ914_41090 [Pseudonocardiaceae bacterium]|nr:hypothetical protein [Pseudonocardiaceae bacterium]
MTTRTSEDGLASSTDPLARSPRWPGVLSLALSGVCFLLYPVLRPYSDEKSLDGARAMSSTLWIVAHLFAVGGFILFGLGILAIHSATRRARGGPIALRSLVVTWVGIGLLLPYYGAEVFGLHAISGQAWNDRNEALLHLVDTVRYNPAAITMFGLGLVLLAAGAVMAARALSRSSVMMPFGGAVFALGFVLYLPQFFAPGPVRMVHGLIVLIGCWLAARSLSRARFTALTS